MAIYKSSYNKKPDKQEKPKKEKKLKPVSTKKVKVNTKLIVLLCCAAVFIACIMPANFIKNFLLGLFGLSVYPISLIGILLSGLLLAKKTKKSKPIKMYIKIQLD